MFIMTKQAVLIYSPDRKETFRASAGEMTNAPEWVAKTKQFNRMVSAGLIVVPEKTKSKSKESKD